MPDASRAPILGRADGGSGVEALVVEIAGASDRRDGGVYYITWSLGLGREAEESNDVIAQCGWTPRADRSSVRLTPAEWP